MSLLDVWKNESENCTNNVLERLAQKKLPVKVYGSGRFALFSAEFLLKNGIVLSGFIDDEKYYFPGKKIRIGDVEYPCEIISNINNTDNTYSIVIGIQDYRRIDYIKRLVSKDVLVEWLDNVDYHLLDNDFLEKHQKQLTEIRSVLVDDESKQVLDAFLNARYNGDPKELVKLVHDDEYLYDWKLLGIKSNDVLVDGGAYIGDTVEELRKYLDGDLKRVFAFEPDADNYEKLKAYIENSGYAYVYPVNAGLFSCDKALRFSASGTMGSSIQEEGETEIRVEALDTHKEYQNATVIKMDIEGSEPDAVLGALKLIQKNKPRLAICIYHNNDHIMKVYDLLKPFGYKFYLRQHGYCAEETVLYAV